MEAKIVVEEGSGNGGSALRLYCCFYAARVKFHSASTTLS